MGGRHRKLRDCTGAVSLAVLAALGWMAESGVVWLEVVCLVLVFTFLWWIW
jgi:hypothetical protein